MIQNVLIRDEKSTDFAVISEVTIAAFETMEISMTMAHYAGSLAR